MTMFHKESPANKWLSIRNGILLVCSAAVVLIFGAANLRAQTGNQTTHWQWSEAAEHHESVVRIDMGNGSGTGILIEVDRDNPFAGGFEGLCFTAWHVVDRGDEDADELEIIVTYRNGKRSRRCQVLEFNETRDIALLRVWVPADVNPVSLAKLAVLPGQQLEFAGLGGGSKLDCCLRHFQASASGPTNAATIYADVALLPGDSGGPVFDQNGELVGIISGGWFWWDGGVRKSNGSIVSVTWPARASNLQPLLRLLERHRGAMELVKN